MANPIEFVRKMPTQKRARQTMDDLFEATAQLLDAEPAGVLNTNRVAERAGFSIGTLYSYFPNKASLLRAMALREIGRFEARFLAQITTAPPDSEADALVRALVRQALAPFQGRQRVRRSLLSLVGHDPAVQTALHQAINRLTDHLLVGIGVVPNDFSESRRFLVLRSVLGPIRAAVLQAPELLAQREFEDELVRLIFLVLGVHPLVKSVCSAE